MASEPESFGVVLFSDGRNGPGWVAVNGGPATPISGIGDLDTSCFWLTNLTWTAFQQSGLSLNGWVRHAKYLRTSLDWIMDEWGLNDLGPDVAASYLSGLFSHVMHLSFEMGATGFRAPALFHEFAYLLPEPELPEVKATEVTRHSLQEWTRTAQWVAKDAELVHLRIPRLVHASEMCRTPMPTGNWKFVDEPQLPPAAKRLRWLEGLNAPVFVRVKLRGVEAVGDTLCFGMGARDARGRPLRREWVSGPELAILREFGEVDVTGAWIGGGFEELPLSSVVQDILGSPGAPWSWAAGVVAENLWVGATLREQFAPRGQEARISWRGAWLRAADRMRMFMVSQRLLQRGWQVHSYGTGVVTVVAPPPGHREDLIRDAHSLGLEVPLSLVAQVKAEVDTWGGADVAAPAALLRVRGHREMLFRLDELPLLSMEEQAQLVGDLMG